MTLATCYVSHMLVLGKDAYNSAGNYLSTNFTSPELLANTPMALVKYHLRLSAAMRTRGKGRISYHYCGVGRVGRANWSKGDRCIWTAESREGLSGQEHNGKRRRPYGVNNDGSTGGAVAWQSHFAVGHEEADFF